MTKSARIWLLVLLLLLVANAAFFLYTRVAGAPEDVAGQISRLEVRPDRIRLLGRNEAARAPAPAQAAAKPPAECLEWGLFTGAAVARADASISRLDLPPGTVRRALVDAGAYWVYIPPAKTRPEVERTLEDLAARRVSDFSLVQDPPQWRNAISLGIYKTEEAAQIRLNALRDNGVHSAIVERRDNILKQVAYYVRQPSIAMVARLAELQREFPGSEVRATPCPGTP
jgi:hypothetical protein